MDSPQPPAVFTDFWKAPTDPLAVEVTRRIPSREAFEIDRSPQTITTYDVLAPIRGSGYEENMNTSKILPLIVVLGGAAVARADVLVNTFGSSGLGYFAAAGWSIDSSQSIGKTFTIANDYNFTEIDLALRLDDDAGQMLVSLRSDNGGQPGTTLESFTVTDAFGAGNSGVYNLASTTNALMTAGTYYVTIDSINGSTGKWNLSNAGGSGAMVASNDGGSTWTNFTDTNGAITVQGTLPVPEPLSMAALGMGCIALIRRRRNSRA